MVKRNIRLQALLFNIKIFTLLIIATAAVLFSADWQPERELQFESTTLVIMPAVFMLIAVINVIVAIVIYIKFYITVKRYNRANPHKPIKFFSTKSLIEFNDEDELLNKTTNEATRKCYVFSMNAIAVILVLLLFELPHVFYIMCIIGVILISNIIYYTYVKKYYE